MRQVRVSKRQRPGDSRLDPLPLDPRDPDIVRAKELSRRAGTAQRAGAVPAEQRPAHGRRPAD